jgi:hypothetical protein
MTKLRLLAGICVVLGLVVIGSAGAKPTTCSGGEIAAGTYDGLVVTGTCTFADDAAITVNGNLTVAPGAVLNDHAGAMGTTVHVTGNVSVGRGAVLGLGNYDPTPPHTSAVVDGNVVATGAATLYLGGATVHGNVIVTGGGDPGRNLPIKDDRIDGNLIVQGWSGLWFGIVRTSVGGNVIANNNVATDPTTLPGIDSSEIVTNTISGNLICQGNVPLPQIGDSEGAPNTVGGKKLGECSGL